jgi:hypothetical protein
VKLTGIPRAERFPRMLRVKQTFQGPAVENVPVAVRTALGRLALPVKAGQSVALTVGSRGVVNIDAIVRATVEHMEALGAHPFIIPAMGSHGGGTAEGQRSVLEHYGVTETTMGCPVRATMDVVQVGEALGLPIWLDRYAAEADWVGVINRIKPHTGFTGDIGSGLLKMMTIGTGKHRGAVQAHRANIRLGYERMITGLGAGMLRSGRIAFGLGVVENGYDETALIEAFLPGELEAGERELLRKARAWMAKLPFEAVDLLIVDEIGKEISGTGMDTNVIGRHATWFEQPFTSPRITFIVACDTTAKTYGNANGIGLADFTTRRLADKIDWEPTYVNALTACSPGGPKLPAVLDSTREAVAVALSCLGLDRPEDARVVRIQNTLRLTEVEVSEAFAADLPGRADLTPLGDPLAMTFSPDGALPPF